MSDNLAILITGGAVTGVFLLFMLLSWLFQGSKRESASLMSEISGESGILDTGRASLRVRRPRNWGEQFEKRFESLVHGTQLGIGKTEALGLIALSGAGLAAICFFWKGYLWLTFGGLILGLALPIGIFMILSGRYQRTLRDQLPDMFYLVARSLRAGLSLPQALKEAERQGLKPLATELGEVNASIKLGLPIATSLERVAAKIQMTDFDALVSAVGLYQTTGGDLALILDRLANGARDRNQFRQQFIASTARGRITAILMGLAVPLLMLIFAMSDPERFDAFATSTYGITMIAIAFSLVLVGVVWIYSLLRVDY